MYAVVNTGGKQYRVSEGDRISVEKLPVEPGSTVALDILFLVDGDKVITDPTELALARVDAVVLDHFLGEKALIFKYKRRKRYRRLRGHRQNLTRLEISMVSDNPDAKKQIEDKDEPLVEADEADEQETAEEVIDEAADVEPVAADIEAADPEADE